MQQTSQCSASGQTQKTEYELQYEMMKQFIPTQEQLQEIARQLRNTTYVLNPFTKSTMPSAVNSSKKNGAWVNL